MTPETQEKIKQLQTYEQQLQQLAAQKQQIESSIFEYENAITESEKAPTAYKIVGTIMVEKNKEDLKKDLSEKKELAEVRLGSIEKQEKQIREKAQALQEELLKEMK
jgi:prefoldin beta subunit